MNQKKITIVIIIFFYQNLLASSNEKISDVLKYLIPSTAYAATLYLDDTQGQREFYKSFGTNVVLTYGLKYSIDKERPNGKKHSFPSGHTSMAFQGATFIHKRYGLYYSLPAYAGAMFVGYSRVDSKNHYWSDVIAGAFIGILSSYFFTTKYQIEPLLVKNTHGLQITYTW